MWDAVILGGGAAGLFCAYQAASRGKRVCVVEHQDRVGKKILISGGGRCNFTNLAADHTHYRSENPHFAKSALARYTPRHFVDLVEKNGVSYVHKQEGQLFCAQSSKVMLNLLLKLCQQSGVTIETNCRVKEWRHDGNVFHLRTSRDTLSGKNFVIAAGGLSFANLGATSIAYDIAKGFELAVVPPFPGLVPFTLSQEERHWTELAGVASPAAVSIGKAVFLDDVLFTHRGLSGPAILQVSSYWQPGERVLIDFFPEWTKMHLVREKKVQPQRRLGTYLATLRPSRLGTHALQSARLSALQERNFAEISDTELHAVERALREVCVTPSDTEGYSKAEVTCGGVDTRELSSQTMASKKIPGLYFIGEAVDVTGELGGYNFQWAWSSAVAAASGLM
jgi:predicted Rossmann fold flavoprotein